jgi:hypothetical protein
MTAESVTSAPVAARTSLPLWRVVRAGWVRCRFSLLGILALFAAVAALEAYQTIAIRSWLGDRSLLACTNVATPALAPCRQSQAWNEFLGSGFSPDRVVFALSGVVVLAAVFGGVRWLSRDYETGVFRYSWTQDAGRGRWLAGNLVLLFAVALVGSAACAVLYDYWYPVARWLVGGVSASWSVYNYPFGPVVFVPFTLAAFGIATLAAALIRRTVPAMAVTLAAVAGLLYLLDFRIRPWLITLSPLTTRTSYGAALNWTRGYFVNGWLTGPAGHVVPGFSIGAGGSMSFGIPLNSQLGKVLTGESNGASQWLTAHHYTTWITYEPASRLPLLHAVGGAALLVIAVLATAAAVWRIRARQA